MGTDLKNEWGKTTLVQSWFLGPKVIVHKVLLLLLWVFFLGGTLPPFLSWMEQGLNNYGGGDKKTSIRSCHKCAYQFNTRHHTPYKTLEIYKIVIFPFAIIIIIIVTMK